MPTLEKLAASGLKYNRFHTTALCSPTRTALLTGHNHHANNAGAIMELATAFPGNTGMRPQEHHARWPRSCARTATAPPPSASTTRRRRGKSRSPGPYDRWPTGSGFDKFYGFIGGETNQWAPAIFDGVDARRARRRRPTTTSPSDMTDQAINWVSAQQALTPDKPFYMYFATGATHAPHHAPKEWIAKYKGQFSGGWDKLREETFARQKKLGVIPADAKLTPRPKEIPAWDDMSAEQKRLFERQMETFAGFAEHTDHEVGRLVAQLEAIGALDNTLFFYIVGDNGASAEGGPEGTYNEMMALNGIIGKADQMMDHIDDWGDPTTFPHFAIGWAWAGNTPFQWTKQVASHFGGTRNGMVLHWPKGIKAKGEIRSQFHHVIDVAPTALEAAKLPQPKIGERHQAAADGRRLDALFGRRRQGRRPPHDAVLRDVRQPRHLSRGLGRLHAALDPVADGARLPPLKDDVWELYNVDEDFSQANNLAAQESREAQGAAGGLPEGGRSGTTCCRSTTAASERFNPAIAGRPDLLGGRKTLTVYPGMTGMMENAFINVKGVHHTITAEVEVKDAKTQRRDHRPGRLLRRLDALHEGRQGRTTSTTSSRSSAPTSRAPTALAPGKHTIVYEFIPDAAKPGTGGKSILSVDGKKVAEGQIPKTQPFAFSADEGADVGLDGETNVSPDYKQGDNAFTGKIVKVTVEQK